MNSKDFFEKLNIELDSLPPMSETLRNEPIVTVDPQEEIKTQTKPKVIKFPFTKQAKKIVTLVASVAVIFCTVIGLVFSGVIGGTTKFSKQSRKSSQQQRRRRHRVIR